MLFNLKRVLVPIDFSEESFQAQKLALEFVSNPGNLHILHVLPRLDPGVHGSVKETMNDSTRKDYVSKQFHKRFGSESLGIHFTVTIGNPTKEIVKYTKIHSIDLIVIPSHGRNGLGRFFLGSVAEKVMLSTTCPVLVLPRDSLKLESIQDQLLLTGFQV
ncbi:MAG: universal stress protein [Prochloron sp. SP5CPC1]|nr:universal stress protein [Candidatus Paraprochloron terpiosi SP5CPC1]